MFVFTYFDLFAYDTLLLKLSRRFAFIHLVTHTSALGTITFDAGW